MGWQRLMARGLLLLALVGCGAGSSDGRAAPGAGGPAAAAGAPATGGAAPVAAASATAPASGSGDGAAAQRPVEKIVFAIPVVTGVFLPHVLAEQRGFFQAEGLTAEFPVMRTNLVVTSLTSGEADYQSMFSPSIPPILSGHAHRVIAATVDKPTRQFMTVPEVTSIQQLKGKAIAVSQIGGGPHNSGILALEAYGMDPQQDVTWLAIGGTQERMIAMQQGGAQASIFSGSEIVRAQQFGFKSLFNLNDVAPLPESGVTTTVQKLETNRDQVKRVLRAIVRSLQYLKSDPEGSIPVVMNFLQVERDEAEDAYQGMVAAFSDDATVSQRSLLYTVDSVKKAQEVKADLPLSQIFDFGPLYETLGEIGITPGPDRAR
jgi:NitT/TauT family transport system substrate-binding protein